MTQSARKRCVLGFAETGPAEGDVIAVFISIHERTTYVERRMRYVAGPL